VASGSPRRCLPVDNRHRGRPGVVLGGIHVDEDEVSDGLRPMGPRSMTPGVPSKRPRTLFSEIKH
jgi:hypothetical protein